MGLELYVQTHITEPLCLMLRVKLLPLIGHRFCFANEANIHFVYEANLYIFINFSIDGVYIPEVIKDGK